MHKIELEIYKFDIFFTVNSEEYSKEVDILFDLDIVNGLCSYNADRRTIHVGVFNKSICTLHHELHHAITFINEGIGSPINRYTTEHNAYLIAYLTKKIIALEKFKLI